MKVILDDIGEVCSLEFCCRLLCKDIMQSNTYWANNFLSLQGRIISFCPYCGQRIEVKNHDNGNSEPEKSSRTKI